MGRFANTRASCIASHVQLTFILNLQCYMGDMRGHQPFWFGNLGLCFQPSILSLRCKQV